MKLEGELQAKIMSWLKAHRHDIWSLKVVGNALQTTGVPDIILCKNGKFVGIELKRPDGKGRTREVQKAHLRRINNAGGIGVVIDDYDEFLKLMEEI